MKTTTILAGIAALAMLCSCSKSDNDNEVMNDTKTITFRVDDLSAKKEAMVKTRAALSDENLTAIEIYDGTTLIKSQASTDEDFGSPTLELTYGTHTLYFVAHRCEGVSYADGVWSATKVKGTFMKKVELNVTTQTATSQSVELDRKIYQLILNVLDIVPTGTATCDITIGEYYGGIRLADFSGVGGESHTTSIDISSVVGKTCTISTFGFGKTADAEYTTGVTVTFKKADGTTIQSHTKADVPLQTNYKTTIKGNFFQTSPAWSITVNSDWTGTKDIDL